MRSATWPTATMSRCAVCNADLPTCEVNVVHDLGRCVRCVGRHIEGVKRLTPRPDVIPFLRLSAADRAELRGIDASRLTVDDLRKIRIDGFDVGWAVLSSLISVAGAAFDLEAQRAYIRDALVSAMAVYRSMQKLIVDLKVDRVYAFNGRIRDDARGPSRRAGQASRLLHPRAGQYLREILAIREPPPPRD